MDLPYIDFRVFEWQVTFHRDGLSMREIALAKNLSNEIKRETSALEQRILRAYLRENILIFNEKSVEVYGPFDLGKVDIIDHTYYIIALRILTAQLKIQEQPNQPKHKHFDEYIIRRYGRRILRPQVLPVNHIYVGNEDSARAAKVAHWRVDNITNEDYEDLQLWLPKYGAHRDDIRQHRSLGACPLQMTLWYLAKKEIEAERKGLSAWNHYPWNGKQSLNPPSSTPSPQPFQPSQNIPPPSSLSAYRFAQVKVHGHCVLYHKGRLESQGENPCTESELSEAKAEYRKELEREAREGNPFDDMYTKALIITQEQQRLAERKEALAKEKLALLVQKMEEEQEDEKAQLEMIE